MVVQLLSAFVGGGELPVVKREWEEGGFRG